MTWKPVDCQVSGTDVYDVYRGQPENFCCGMGFRVKLEDFNGETAIYWNAGAGLDDPDAEGHGGWGREVLVEKNADGDWVCTDWGTGGYSVLLPFRLEEASLEELLDAFFLTSGFTHQWRTAKYIAAQPLSELNRLPELLEGRTKEEIGDFGSTMTALYREHPDREEDWVTPEELREAMGEYAYYFCA